MEPTTYSQPTTLWRLRHPDGRVAHAVIVPRWRDSSAVWFINDAPEEARDFEDWEQAMKWTADLKDSLLRNAWVYTQDGANGERP